jgi:S1-C subfamily serine protease
MLNFKILYITFALFSLIISIQASPYSQISGISNPFSNLSPSTTPLPPTAQAPINKIITPTNSFLNNGNHFLKNSPNLLSNNTSFSSTTPLPPTAQAHINKIITPTNSFLNNGNHFLKNSPNLLSNNNLDSHKINATNMFSQNTSNYSSLSDLYNLTANSVVEITAFNNNNHSLFKIGSGFVYNHNGKSIIITASNLVVGKDIAVTLPDGPSFNSTLIGYDPLTTIAILSTKNIPQSKIIPIQLANSTNLKVGQAVTTIGNTRDFSNILINGLISGIGKSIPTFGQNLSGPTAKIPNGIVTNLNFDSGYGGSPLLDMQGQVIGMNIGNFTLPTNPSKNTGISFAVPSNAISKIIPSLLSKGYYSHPWLGAYGVDVNLDIAKALHLNETKGFIVIAVANASPAKKAGILGGDNTTSINGRKITLGGDIILKVDNKNIQNIQDLSNYIENKKNIGDDMLVTLLRNGIMQLIHVRLEANPNYFLPVK